MGGALAVAAVVYGRNSDEKSRNVVADSTGGRERGETQTQTRAAFVFKACLSPHAFHRQKKTASEMAGEAPPGSGPAPEAPVKRGRGRPKGSKDKKPRKRR